MAQEIKYFLFYFTYYTFSTCRAVERKDCLMTMKFKKILSALLSSAILVLMPAAPVFAGNAAKSKTLQIEKNQAVKQLDYGDFDRAEYKRDVVIIKLKNAKSYSGLLNTYPYCRYLSSIVKRIGNDGTCLAELKKGLNPDAAVAGLAGCGALDFIEPDYEYRVQDFTTDPRSSEQWGLENDGQRINNKSGISGVDINIKKAWTITKGSANVVVGVLDTGVDMNHEDLKDNIWVNTKEIPGNGIDDDGNGYVDDVNGWDFFNNTNKVFDPNDQTGSRGHGTLVSGVIAASQNNNGVVGVAPQVKIMPLKCESGGGYISDDSILSAILYAQKMGVKIINCSWGSYDYDIAMKNTMAKSDILFVCGACNSSCNNDTCPAYPASYNLPNEISVAAVDNTGKLADFSNYGENTVDVAAPGVDILSTTPLGYGIAGQDNNDDFESGTSFAAPFVTGVAALLLSQGVEDPAQIKDIITSSCKPLSQLKGKVKSGGIIDAYVALTYDKSKEIPGSPLNAENKGTLRQGDNDVYYADLSAGQTLTLNLTGDSSAGLYAKLFASSIGTVKSDNGLIASFTSAESFTADVTGRYYVDIIAKNGAGSFDIGSSENTPASLFTADDAKNTISYAGSWTAQTAPECENGTVHTLNSQGSVTYSFTGSEIKWEGTKSANQGMAAVIIDGENCGDVNLYSSTAMPKQILFDKKLNYGTHKIVIKWTGRSGNKRNAGINIDAFTLSTARTLPVPTKLFQYVTIDKTSIGLEFDNVNDGTVKSYAIYRSSDGTAYSCIHTIPAENKSMFYYNDNSLSKGIYYYKVASVDSAGNLSDFSKVLKAALE